MTCYDVLRDERTLPLGHGQFALNGEILTYTQEEIQDAVLCIGMELQDMMRRWNHG